MKHDLKKNKGNRKKNGNFLLNVGYTPTFFA